MTNEELQIFVQQLSVQYFQKLFQHKAYFNSRLRTTGGRYLLVSHHIEVNPKMYEAFGLEEIQGIILHELCHYHLHIEGKGYKHQDREFQALLMEVGAPRFCSTLKTEKRKSTYKLHTYQCTQCHSIYKRKRRVDIHKYCCGKCRGKIIWQSKGE